MPIFSGEYPTKSNPANNDKFLISDSEASGAIKGVSKDDIQESFSAGLLGDTKYITASGNYVKPARLKYIIVEVVGGGGSGSGVNATSASTIGAAGGGGGGGYSTMKILAVDLDSVETVIVGAGGSAPSGGSANSGGDSSFGSFCSASGGAGGYSQNPGSATGYIVNGAAGGMGSGGDLNLPGSIGNSGWADTANNNKALGGAGGDSRYGTGGRSTAAVSAGVAGSGYGSGGSGAATTHNQTAKAGGAGAPGIVVVKEYF